ncbi:MAG: hypothetical protein ACLUDK_14265 [Clostridium paraputrificum]
MDTILAYICGIGLIILTIVIYINWTSRERVFGTREGINDYRIRRMIYSFFIASAIIALIYWILTKIVTISVIIIKWSLIFVILSSIVIFIIGLFSKQNLGEN